MSHPVFEIDECIGCGICVDECPQDVFAIEGGIDDLHAMDAQDHWPCLAR